MKRLLSTMVLVVISVTVCMYAGLNDELKTRYPAEMEILFYDADGQQDVGTFDRMTDEIESVIKENGRVVTGRQKGIYVGAAVLMSGNKVMAQDQSNLDFSNMYVLEVMTKQGFEEYMHQSIPDISDGNVAVMADPLYDQKTIEIGDAVYPVEQSIEIPAEDEMGELVGGSVIVIVKDEAAFEEMRQQLADMETAANGEEKKITLTYMMNFDVSGSEQEKIACANAVRERISDWQNDETNPNT